MSEQAVQDWIRKTVASNDVVLFMKGTKNFPQCGFSAQVAQILGHMGVDYKDINVLEDMGIREGIKSFSQWPTIPQLYVKGEFVGGCDIIREMFQQGELTAALRREGRRLRQGQDDGLRPARPVPEVRFLPTYCRRLSSARMGGVVFV